jgi:hypothetical protein
VTIRPEDLESIANAREVVITTRSADRGVKTVIWVVVDDGEVFVRSVRGSSGRWYRRALADPEVTLTTGDAGFELRAALVTDPGMIDRVSESLRRKYPPGRSLDSMLRPEVLETTLHLEPT